MTEPADVFVTGATGFLGGYFLRLMVERGHRVWALARSTSARAHLDDLDITWIEGDVTDGDRLAASVTQFAQAAHAEGRASWFVHGAAVISYATRSGAQQDAVNVQGTRNAVRAACEAKVTRMLHVSSVVTVGLALNASSAIDEAEPFASVQNCSGRPFVSDYMRTKCLAEQAVLAAVQDGLDAVIVNPGAIFGEAPVPSNTARIFMRVDKSLIGRLAGPGSLSVVGVSDVAKGMQLALERGQTGERYLLCESSLRLTELMERIASELGRDFRIHAIGPSAWRLLVACTRLVDKFKPLQVVTPTALELLALQFRFDSSKARRELGWEPRPFDEVLSETADWLRRIGKVGRAESKRL